MWTTDACDADAAPARAGDDGRRHLRAPLPQPAQRARLSPPALSAARHPQGAVAGPDRVRHRPHPLAPPSARGAGRRRRGAAPHPLRVHRQRHRAADRALRAGQARASTCSAPTPSSSTPPPASRSPRRRSRTIAHVGVDAARVRVIPNGVRLDEFAALPPRGSFRRAFGLGDGPLIVFVGKITPRKGVDVLLRALARLPSERAAGRGRQLHDARAADPRHRRGAAPAATACCFPGLLLGDDRNAAYVDADVVAYPSTDEIFGLVAAEALMCQHAGRGLRRLRLRRGRARRRRRPPGAVRRSRARWPPRCRRCSTIPPSAQRCAANGRHYVETASRLGSASPRRRARCTARSSRTAGGAVKAEADARQRQRGLAIVEVLTAFTLCPLPVFRLPDAAARRPADPHLEPPRRRAALRRQPAAADYRTSRRW